MKYQERLRGLREDNDYSQQYIANQLKIAQTTNSQYELGQRSLPIECLINLCKIYGTSADYILGLTETKN